MGSEVGVTGRLFSQISAAGGLWFLHPQGCSLILSTIWLSSALRWWSVCCPCFGHIPGPWHEENFLMF